MRTKIFKISVIAIIVILTTTFIFIGKINSSKNNLLENSTSNTKSKEKVKQKDITQKTENQKELPKEKNESVDVMEKAKEDIKENKVSSNTSTTSTTSNNSNEIKQNNNQQNQSQSNNNQIKEETVKENNDSYIGVPNPNDFNYSFHKGKIEYSSMDACLSASEKISLKDTVDIINSWCMDVVDGQGTVLGEYLYINCSSGNCNKYKD